MTQFSRDAVDSMRSLPDDQWFAVNLTVRARLRRLKDLSLDGSGRARAVLFPGQMALQEADEAHRDPLTRAVRLFSTEGRRSGKTALWMMHGIRQLVEMDGGFRGAIMLHLDAVTRRTRYEFERMYCSLPQYLQHPIDLSNAKEITFPSVDGRLFIATAESKGFGGGEDLSYGLIDEIPKWPETFADDLLDDIESAATPDACLFFNGAPECGPEHPFALKWRSGDYPTVLVPAWQSLECHAGPRDDWSDVGDLDPDEQMCRAAGAPASYVRWRRARLRRFTGSESIRLVKYRQKYPEFEIHLFEALGSNPAISPDRIQARLNEIERRGVEPLRIVDFATRRAA